VVGAGEGRGEKKEFKKEEEREVRGRVSTRGEEKKRAVVVGGTHRFFP
jgi:hypothetical protein